MLSGSVKTPSGNRQCNPHQWLDGLFCGVVSITHGRIPGIRYSSLSRFAFAPIYGHNNAEIRDVDFLNKQIISIAVQLAATRIVGTTTVSEIRHRHPSTIRVH